MPSIRKTNLLQETIEILEKNGVTLDDVRFIHTSFGDFIPKFGGRKFLDVDYDSYSHIDPQLKLVGADWWIERHEDMEFSVEWWEFKRLPVFGEKATRFVSPIFSDNF